MALAPTVFVPFRAGGSRFCCLILTNMEKCPMNSSLYRARNREPFVALLLFLLLLTGLLSAARPAQAVTAELFFSEYIEGSSNNKALEIYNGTGSAVDLAAGGYNVQVYFNGSASAGLTINLAGTVTDGDVFVLGHSSANATILAQADQTNGAGWFNGDDAVVLRKGTAVIDSLGQVGFDPGTEWGSGLLSTADNTLRRKAAVCAGDTDASNAFDPASEWDGFATDTFDGLGAHTANCDGTAEDFPPTVTATDPADGATDVPVGNNVTVTFSESVDVAAGAIAVACPSGNQVATNDAASDVTSVTLDPASDLPATTACTITIDAAGVTDNDGAPDTLAGATSFGFTTGAATVVTPIHTIQGSGSTVTPGAFTVEAIVVGDYQASNELRGFFLQEEDAEADADPATSEGIFVFCSGCPVDVSVGDLVRATGSSTDFFGMSQLSATTADSVSVVSTGNPLPTPATIDLPVPGVPTDNLAAATAAINAYFEAYEGMLVTFPDTLAVSEYFELARYGQVILTEGGREHTFTADNEPSAGGLIAHEINLASRTIILDDTNNIQNSPITTSPNTPYYHPVPGLSTTNYFRGGDTITNLTGVLHWSFAGQSGTDAWRIRPVTEAFSYAFTPENVRPDVPEVGGSLKVASFNVLNYFLTVDTTSSNSIGFCGPSGTMDCRGADSQAELDRQRAKLLTALAAIDADVYGLMEMENTPGVEPLADIVSGLPGYAYVDTGVIGTDAIRVGIIYRTSAVTPVGDYAILDSSVDPRFDDSLNRPALAQSFEEIATGGRFTVVVNHLKSKGSSCGEGDDDLLTGQGNCNGARTLAAQALADWLATDPTGSGDADVLIIGDLNSYAMEDPIVALESAGYTNLVRYFGGLGAYSYVFDGQLGYLDHALSNASLTPQVTGVAEWHVNADEVPLFDYNDDERTTGEASFEEESDARLLYEADPFRTSDHDPVIVGLNLIAYNFDGFFPPVDNPPAFNVANAGRAIPVKFSLNGDRGLDIFAEGYPQATVIDCDGGAPQAGVEETVTAGASSLSYDPETDTYTYVWKTERSWREKCVLLTIQLNDGTTHVAYFRFTR